MAAVRLVDECASVTVLCDMPQCDLSSVKVPDGVSVVHCSDGLVKEKWYKKAFLCVHMGQGEDDLALVDMIGHGVPVVVNRNAHHISLLGREYPLFAIRPDVQSIRACIKRAVSDADVYTQAVMCIRELQATSYSKDSAATQIKAMFSNSQHTVPPSAGRCVQ